MAKATTKTTTTTTKETAAAKEKATTAPASKAVANAPDEAGANQPSERVTEPQADLEKLAADAYQKGYSDALDDMSRDQLTEPGKDEQPGEHEDGQPTEPTPEPSNELHKRLLFVRTAYRLPANLRRGGIELVVNDVAAFVETLAPESQWMAAEIIDAIAANNPGDVPSGRYKDMVKGGINVVHSLPEFQIDRIDYSRAVKEEAERLSMVVPSNDVPAAAAARQQPGEGEGDLAGKSDEELLYGQQ
jgi:hypothetical protein